ncbi:hypothetical protein FDI40_gp069 [Agrobacterium phage Atu_ph07]|uniref:Uncharacterized protein n=1 Tax=Agrobacterium phage Atu_ph07 TaxID=2024264 RepID=A0A2L0UZC6_9CAUD|nr:hypothetical protein FDI40_gp069 [Agrobacterium phage Atu_ph07]AUZ94881.1 hypothetical protein [Agrobacterium phage Atu_ph07]
MSYTGDLREYIRALSYITEGNAPEVEETVVYETIENDYKIELKGLLSDLDDLSFKLLNNRMADDMNGSYIDGFEAASMWTHERVSQLIAEYTKRLTELSNAE